MCNRILKNLWRRKRHIKFRTILINPRLVQVLWTCLLQTLSRRGFSTLFTSTTGYLIRFRDHALFFLMRTTSESARANGQEVNFASLEVLLRRGLMRGMDLSITATMASLASRVVETLTHPVSTNNTTMLSFSWAFFFSLASAQKWCAFFSFM